MDYLNHDDTWIFGLYISKSIRLSKINRERNNQTKLTNKFQLFLFVKIFKNLNIQTFFVEKIENLIQYQLTYILHIVYH